jgi:2-C-methyl-D-erythritol 4-phosphate cytidylyltransferase
MRPPDRASEHRTDVVGGRGQMPDSCAALVVAAGSGERLGAGRPKAFVVVAGRPLVAWSLKALAAAAVPRVVVAVPPGHGAAAEEAVAGAAAGFPLGLALVEGGVTRSESVRNALAAAGDVEAVVVHDAARPLAPPELFRSTLAALADTDAAIAAAPVTDTIKEAGSDGLVVRTHDRSRLWAVQTPQAFRTAALRRALDVSADVLAAATDDAWLVERAGGSVRVIESPPANFKVTTPHDLAIAESLLC